MEAFAPQTDLFLPLHLSLPEARGCCLFVYNDLLVVQSAYYVLKFAEEQKGELILRSHIQFQEENRKAPSSQPVLDPTRRLVFLFQFDQCFVFDIETGAKVQSII